MLAVIVLLICTQIKQTVYKDAVRSIHNRYTMPPLPPLKHWQGVLLPALTLAVLDEGQLNELMFHEGGSHQLHTHQGKNRVILQTFSALIISCSTLKQVGFCVLVCAYTSMVIVCVSKGTHSMASSAQQPPHRFTDTQDGTKRWCVSPGSSLQTSTRVSRGSQPLRE